MSKFATAIRWFWTELTLASTTWSGPEAARADAARHRSVDLAVAALAAALPWSTSAAGILAGVALFLIVPTVHREPLLSILKRPAGTLPLAFVFLAVVGTLWADVSWKESLSGIKPLIKLIAIPFLLYHFRSSRHGAWVFVSFLTSCTLLMGLSWIVVIWPELKVASTASAGVPVKNYIDQSQEFTLCMVALLPCVAALYKRRRYLAAVASAALVLAFFANMAFVVSARTALIYVPAMLTVLALRYLDLKQSAMLFAGATVTAAVVWFASPYLRGRIVDIATEYQYYRQDAPLSQYYKHDVHPSTGQRLVYWQKSLRFFRASPIVGNGTGSIETLFKRDAIGRTGLDASITRNPHNQTLNVAVQWGIIGTALLYAMWLSHALLFREDGFANWIGLLIVVQNLLSSFLNSHLFDFNEGWMYVMGVGVAGGMSLAIGPKKDRPSGADGNSYRWTKPLPARGAILAAQCHSLRDVGALACTVGQNRKQLHAPAPPGAPMPRDQWRTNDVGHHCDNLQPTCHNVGLRPKHVLARLMSSQSLPITDVQ